MATHYIGKQEVLLELRGKLDAYAIQQEAAVACRDTLLAKLQARFDQLAGPDVVLKVDKLEIDLGEIQADGFGPQFEAALLEKLDAALRAAIAGGDESPAKAVQVSAQAHFFDQWLQFLENGFWPGWNAPPDEALTPRALTFLTAESLAIPRLGRLLQGNALARRRLALQSGESYWEILAKLMYWPAEAPSLLRRIEAQIGDLQLRDAFRIAVAAALRPAGGMNVATFLAKVIRNDLPPYAAAQLAKIIADLHGTPQLPAKERALARQLMMMTHQLISPKASTAQDTDHQAKTKPSLAESKTGLPATAEEVQADSAIEMPLYVPFAGAVLLHVFLPRFFGHFDLLEENRFRDPAAAERGLHLLYHLVSGGEAPHEPVLPLLKLLCGLPLAWPVARELPLSEAERSEALELLQAAIRHWEALKNTSPDGLREAFLQRSGKLTQLEESWSLTVETRAQDILLGRLPWGIGTIKLPWMPLPLYVNWN